MEGIFHITDDHTRHIQMKWYEPRLKFFLCVLARFLFPRLARTKPCESASRCCPPPVSEAGKGGQNGVTGGLQATASSSADSRPLSIR